MGEILDGILGNGSADDDNHPSGKFSTALVKKKGEGIRQLSAVNLENREIGWTRAIL